MKLGSWNFKRIVESGDENKIYLLDKYIDQALYRIIKSVQSSPNNETGPDSWVLVADMENFDFFTYHSLQSKWKTADNNNYLEIQE